MAKENKKYIDACADYILSQDHEFKNYLDTKRENGENPLIIEDSHIYICASLLKFKVYTVFDNIRSEASVKEMIEAYHHYLINEDDELGIGAILEGYELDGIIAEAMEYLCEEKGFSFKSDKADYVPTIDELDNLNGLYEETTRQAIQILSFAIKRKSEGFL
jgi:hypothetical protein